MEQKNNLTLGSLFDGSGGFPLGGLLAGITPVWASEVEPFPIRVTTKRLPFIKHYGDVSKMSGGDIEPVDIITFGSPCQDMSVAGKRAGLDGSRSNLFFEAVRIVKEMRCATNGQYPRWLCWENVPGVFSSNGGADFKAVLESICKIKDEELSIPECKKWESAGEIVGDGFSVAWRVLDAQFWGVPQRRKRIFLIADLAGGSAGQILFESEGLSGYTPQGFRAGQGTACGASAGTESAGVGFDGYNGCLTEDKSSTLGVNCGMSTGRNGVVEAYGICSKDSNSMKSDNPNSGFYKADSSRTLDGNGGNPTCNQGGIAVVEGIPFTQNQRDEVRTLGDKSGALCKAATKQQTYILQGSMIGRKDGNGPQGDGVDEDVSFTLNTVDRHAVYAMTTGDFTQVCKEKSQTLMARDYKDPSIVNEPSYGIGRDAFNQGKNAQYKPSVEEELQPTLVAKGPGAVAKAEPEYTVRRLTPTECARLQGFPDWWCSDLGTEDPSYGEVDFWTDVFETHRKIMGTSSKPKTQKQILKWLKEPYSDAAEYKMWGNGIALPCVYFILCGIVWYARNVDK